jgi:hypothetical protein
MSTKAKKQASKSKTKHDFPKEATEIKDSAISYLGEVEKSGENLATEVKHFFEQLADHVSSVASTAAKTTVAVTEKVSGANPAPHLSRALDEVKDAGEVSLRAIGEGFDSLREYIVNLAPAGAKTPKESPAAKKTVKKKTSVKKSATKKKTAAKKSTRKTAVSKKAAAKKVVKKPAAGKKAAKKKVVKKPAAKKKVSATKVVKKPVAKKKAAVRKVASKKTV